ncbi:GIN domain-containing protein [Geodermatophilus sp. SYSU D00815]
MAGVTGVRLQTSGTLSITPALAGTAGSVIIDRLTSDVDDGILVLGLAGPGASLGDVRYTLTLPRVDSLVVKGSGDVVAESVPSDSLSIAVDGSGQVEVSGVAVDRLDVALTGSGTVEAEGSAGTQEVLVQGSGDYAAVSLDSRRATVTVSGSGNAEVRVTETLAAVVEGSGDIRHSGGADVTSTVEDSGEVVEG